MLVLVDGYNVTKGDPATSGLDLEEQRDALVRRLRASQRELFGRASVTVVFDGQPGIGDAPDAGAIRVRFSQGGSADDLIVAIAAKSTGVVTVYSADRALGERVAAAVSTFEMRDRSALFEGASQHMRKSQPGRRTVDRDTGLPAGANKITQELKDIWLEE